MKILVAVKSVVDANIKVKLDQDGNLDVAALKKSMNPFDEIAMEQAVQLKEKGAADEVVAVTVGAGKAGDVLRIALAMGADRAVFVETDHACEPLVVADLIKAVADTEKPDLILLGKQAIDDDSNQVGQMVAALCDMPQATHASEIKIEAGKAEVTREIDGGLETVLLDLPAVVTADLRLNAPRYVTLPMMMKAKKKPMQTIKADTLGVDMTAHLEHVAYEAPEARKTGVMVNSVDELIEKLKNEAKVL